MEKHQEKYKNLDRIISPDFENLLSVVGKEKNNGLLAGSDGKNSNLDTSMNSLDGIDQPKIIKIPKLLDAKTAQNIDISLNNFFKSPDVAGLSRCASVKKVVESIYKNTNDSGGSERLSKMWDGGKLGILKTIFSEEDKNSDSKKKTFVFV